MARTDFTFTYKDQVFKHGDRISATISGKPVEGWLLGVHSVHSVVTIGYEKSIDKECNSSENCIPKAREVSSDINYCYHFHIPFKGGEPDCDVCDLKLLTLSVGVIVSSKNKSIICSLLLKAGSVVTSRRN